MIVCPQLLNWSLPKLVPMWSEILSHEKNNTHKIEDIGNKFSILKPFEFDVKETYF